MNKRVGGAQGGGGGGQGAARVVLSRRGMLQLNLPPAWGGFRVGPALQENGDV